MTDLWFCLIGAASMAGALLNIIDALEGKKKDSHNCWNSHASRRATK